MNNIKCILLISTCLFLSKESQAEINLTFDASNISSSNFTLHTHHTPVELKPISASNSGVKFTAVCALANGGCNGISFIQDNNEINFDPIKQCSDEGYNITSCPSGQIRVDQCPYNNIYYRSCSTSEEVCNAQGYSVTTCNKPQYPSDACPENSSLYKSCQEDNTKACEEQGYLEDCKNGEVVDGSQACPYDVNYNKCVCNPCSGYEFTLLEAQSEGWHVQESCSSCGVLKYKREAESCLGYLVCDNGGAVGARECMSGSVKKFESCKEEPKVCSAGLWDLDNYYCNGALRCYVPE